MNKRTAKIIQTNLSKISIKVIKDIEKFSNHKLAKGITIKDLLKVIH